MLCVKYSVVGIHGSKGTLLTITIWKSSLPTKWHSFQKYPLMKFALTYTKEPDSSKVRSIANRYILLNSTLASPKLVWETAHILPNSRSWIDQHNTTYTVNGIGTVFSSPFVSAQTLQAFSSQECTAHVCRAIAQSGTIISKESNLTNCKLRTKLGQICPRVGWWTNLQNWTGQNG